MRCLTRRYVDAVHVEIFVDRKVLLLPAGIGLRPPLRRAGLARLHGGQCAYPLHTLDPTGTVFVDRARPRALGDLFAVWGQRLAPRRLLSFAGRVRVFRNGREWRGDPRRRAARAARLGRAPDRRLREAPRVLPVPGGPVNVRRAAGLAAVGLVAAACGGGSGSPAPPTVAPAKEYTLDWAGPKAVAKPGKTTLRLAVRTPDGKILTRFRTGGGPHTGVHVIIVRDDLSSIIHKHPPVPASGRLALPVTLPSAGRYHVLVDVYPAADSGPAQLPAHARPPGRHGRRRRRRCPPMRRSSRPAG